MVVILRSEPSSTFATETVPAELVQAILRDRLADPSAGLTDLQVEPISSDGYSGSRLYRARLAWGGGRSATATHSATWILKRWLPGGQGERLLGVDRPLEALAWERGILRPEALPPGVVAPIVGTRLDPSGDAAWIVMEDVSTALGAYSRERPLLPDTALARVKQVLDGLARLHAWWEYPRRQAALGRHSGLVPLERFLWCEAASYATVLGRTPPTGIAPGSPVTEELRADVRAFLDWLPAGDRPVMEELLYRREPLIEALAPFPRTLLHGDVDDRNVGLRPRGGRAAIDGNIGAAPELVLIDWEWIAVGPPALDVARLCASAGAVCSPSHPRPAALFSDELPDYYFERYRAHGGTLADRDAWHRSFALALLAGGLSQVPFAGSMIRHAVAPVVEAFERQVEMVLPVARSIL